MVFKRYLLVFVTVAVVVVFTRIIAISKFIILLKGHKLHINWLDSVRNRENKTMLTVTDFKRKKRNNAFVIKEYDYGRCQLSDTEMANMELLKSEYNVQLFKDQRTVFYLIYIIQETAWYVC